MNGVHWTQGDTAAAVVVLFFIVCLRYAARRTVRRRRERREFDADMARAEGIIAENRKRSPLYAARHAATRPRTSPAVPAPAPRQDQDFRADRKRGGGLGGPSPATQAGQRRPRRVVTTAVTADVIAPVIWPEPGTSVPVRPQAAPEPSRHTAAMDALTATGEMRALTDQFIHEMRYGEEQYRKGLRGRPAADDARPDGPAPARAYGAGPLNPGRIVFGEPRDRPEMLP